jgi:predicted nucleic acid-binding protein
VVDTDILIDALRGFGLGLDYIEDAEQHGTLHISITTEMELIIGCRNRRELYRLERFLRRCTILAMTETIAARAVTLLRQYRLSHGLSITDALIAASALVYSDTLYTKNVRDFQMIPALTVVRPYEKPSVESGFCSWRSPFSLAFHEACNPQLLVRPVFHAVPDVSSVAPRQQPSFLELIATKAQHPHPYIASYAFVC